MLRQDVVLRQRIPVTEWHIKSLVLQILEGRNRAGEISLTNPKNLTEKHTWSAQYKGEGTWDIKGDGALDSEGKRVPAVDAYPFSKDPMVNHGVKRLLSNWLNENTRSSTEADVSVSLPPAAPKVELPRAGVIMLPVQPESKPERKPLVAPVVAERKVEPVRIPEPVKTETKPKIENKGSSMPKSNAIKQISNPQVLEFVRKETLKKFDVTDDQFTGTFTGLPARQVFCHIAKDLLGQGGGKRVVEAIGAESNTAVYNNSGRGKERLGDNDDLANWASDLVKKVTDMFQFNGSASESAGQKPAVTTSREPKKTKVVKPPKSKRTAKSDEEPDKSKTSAVVVDVAGVSIEAQMLDYLVYGYLKEEKCSIQKLVEAFGISQLQAESIVGRVHIKVLADPTGLITGTIQRLVAVAKQFPKSDRFAFK